MNGTTKSPRLQENGKALLSAAFKVQFLDRKSFTGDSIFQDCGPKYGRLLT